MTKTEQELRDTMKTCGEIVMTRKSSPRRLNAARKLVEQGVFKLEECGIALLRFTTKQVS